MSEPLVSICMAAYNADSFIAMAVESIIDQTYSNFELLIFNDGSTDNTAHVLKKYRDSRIRIIDSTINRGIGHTRNQAISQSKGKYLFWMDADDKAHLRRIEKQVWLLESDPSIVLCGTGAFVINESEEILHKKIPKAENDEIKAAFFFGFPFVNPSIGIRTDVLKAQHIQIEDDIKLSEDYVLLSKLIPYGKFINIQEPLYYYRTHSNVGRATSATNGQQIIYGRKAAWKIILNYLNIRTDNRVFDLHDKITYYRQNINANDISAVHDYLVVLNQILTKNSQKQIFNQSILSNHVHSFAYMAIMHPLLPLADAMVLLVKFNHLMKGVARLTVLPKKVVKSFVKKKY